MLGNPTEYTELHTFFTDQYDLGMEYVGYAPDYARVVFRGDVDGREFVAFWLDGDNRVLAGMNVNVWDVLDDVKALIRSRSPVDPDKLADPQQARLAYLRLAVPSGCTATFAPAMSSRTVTAAFAASVITASVRESSGCEPQRMPSRVTRCGRTVSSMPRRCRRRTTPPSWSVRRRPRIAHLPSGIRVREVRIHRCRSCAW